MEEGEPVKVLVNKPKDSRFHQQRLRSWRPVLTAKGAYPIFLTLGILFIPLGAFLLVTSNQVVEKVFEYTHCQRSGASTLCSDEIQKPGAPAFSTCPCKVEFTLNSPMEGTVYFYYGLSNFFQNHRRYIMSKDDDQLQGKTGTLSSDCEPYRYNASGFGYAPCGAIAASLFNDTFDLKYHGTSQSPQTTSVPMSNKNIAWRSDVEVKYGQPPASSWEKTTKPVGWLLTALERSKDAYSGDEELLVWMRPAALPTFRKLHRILTPTGIFQKGLPAGRYSVDIQYAYPVTRFGGTKRFILTTSNWLGGRNPSLGIAYIVVGSISLLLGLAFLTLHQCIPRRLEIYRIKM